METTLAAEITPSTSEQEISTLPSSKSPSEAQLGGGQENGGDAIAVWLLHGEFVYQWWTFCGWLDLCAMAHILPVNDLSTMVHILRLAGEAIAKTLPPLGARS